MNKIDKFIKEYMPKKEINFKAGDEIGVYSKVKEGEKTKSEMFEGLVIKRNHGKESGATFTVRKVFDGIAVERTFPLYSPIIEKVEVFKSFKTRRSKLYFLRDAKGKRARLKEIKNKPTNK